MVWVLVATPRGRTTKPQTSSRPFRLSCWSGHSVGLMPDSDELARMMLEISAGWEWGDPRSEVPQTPEHEASWGRLKVQMQEIADMGGIVDIPSDFPDISGYRNRKDVGPPDNHNPKSTMPVRPSPPREIKESEQPSDTGQVERTYLVKERGDEPSILYMVEKGPGYLNDRVLHEDGWVATPTLWDWRIGDRSDIDIVSRDRAKVIAERWGAGQFVK